MNSKDFSSKSFNGEDCKMNEFINDDLRTFPAECMSIYRPELKDNGIVVVLPSIGNKHLPFYTRKSWESSFSQCCFIAIADPALIKQPDLAGTWFLDKNGSWLIPLANWLKEFANVNEHKTRIIFAGSSMGGYASIVLSMLVEGSFVFAECPQIDLFKYPGSKKAIEKIYPESSIIPTCVSKFFNICALMDDVNKIPSGIIYIPLSDLRHVKHIQLLSDKIGCHLHDHNNLPFINLITENYHKGPFEHAILPKSHFVVMVNKLLKMELGDSIINFSQVREISHCSNEINLSLKATKAEFEKLENNQVQLRKELLKTQSELEKIKTRYQKLINSKFGRLAASYWKFRRGAFQSLKKNNL